MKRVGLGKGGEFDLIRSFTGDDSGAASGVGDAGDIAVGPGDDAAVLQDGWVVTTDLSIEEVHFRRAWLTDEEIGWRAGAVALSDLAAMAATPVAVLVSMAVPRDAAGAAPDLDVEAVQRGVRAAAGSVGASVVGGDLTRSPGPLVIDVVALGRTTWPILRDGAEPGDHVWVTGPLGASAAAVALWTEGEEPGPELRAAFAHPEPRVSAACCLVEQEVVDALIDLSDGLAGDVCHVAAASGVSVVLDEDAIPVADAVVAAFGRERGLHLALHGGEDYELCFVTDPGAVDVAYFQKKYGLELTRVGTVEALGEGEAPGVRIRRTDGRVEELEQGGFDHWAGS